MKKRHEDRKPSPLRSIGRGLLFIVRLPLQFSPMLRLYTSIASAFRGRDKSEKKERIIVEE
jgi:hypothetical protein